MASTKHGLTVRGDSLYCPLPLALETYWACEPDCFHCYFRGLNHVWGSDLRPISLEALDRKLTAGLKNKNPKTPLAHCLSNKNTIRIGNKSDPFQPVERDLLLTTRALRLFRKHRWSIVVQTRFSRNARELAQPSLSKLNRLGLLTMLPILSPGLEKDWELFERERTTPIPQRIEDMKAWVREGIPVGVNGEPFIPGHHSVADFEEALKLIKSAGVRRYNTYNFHFTPFVAKRIYTLPGVDIEKIWEMNKDRNWKPILQQLIDLAKKHNITLGCPDFVNTGPLHREVAGTCCGIDPPNPTRFNTHYFKRLAQDGLTTDEIIEETWDGSADREEGRKIIEGKTRKMYTLKDAGVV